MDLVDCNGRPLRLDDMVEILDFRNPDMTYSTQFISQIGQRHRITNLSYINHRVCLTKSQLWYETRYVRLIKPPERGLVGLVRRYRKEEAHGG